MGRLKELPKRDGDAGMNLGQHQMLAAVACPKPLGADLVARVTRRPALIGIDLFRCGYPVLVWHNLTRSLLRGDLGPCSRFRSRRPLLRAHATFPGRGEGHQRPGSSSVVGWRGNAAGNAYPGLTHDQAADLDADYDTRPWWLVPSPAVFLRPRTLCNRGSKCASATPMKPEPKALRPPHTGKVL
jgi:hypothetical protein